MDLHLTSEQTLLRDSAAKFIAAAGPKVARGFREQEPSFAPARLRQAGELGWLGILVPSAANGLGLGLTELALVLEQAGRGLVCEPIGFAAIAAAALAQGRTPHPMLERAMTGDALVVPALQESGVWRRPAGAAHASGGEGRSAASHRTEDVRLRRRRRRLSGQRQRTRWTRAVLCGARCVRLHAVDDADGGGPQARDAQPRRCAGRSHSLAPVVAQRGRCAPRSRADGVVVRIARRDGKGAGDRRSTTCASASSSGS